MQIRLTSLITISILKFASMFFHAYRKGLPISTIYMKTGEDKKGSVVRSFDSGRETGSIPFSRPPCQTVVCRGRWSGEAYLLPGYSIVFKMLVSFE